MPAFIVLLRGVNVGRAKRVPMAELRALLLRLGYTRVVTVLNSGNAVFHAPKGAPARHAADVAAAIARRLNLDVPVVVKSAKEFAAIVAENDLGPDAVDPSRLIVAFTQTAAVLRCLAAIETLVAAPERFVLGRNAAYLYCASGILESKAGAALLGKSGQTVTTRNWATVLKLHALASADSKTKGAEQP